MAGKPDLIWALVVIVVLALALMAIVLMIYGPICNDCQSSWTINWSLACVDLDNHNSTVTASCLATHGVPATQTAAAAPTPLPWWHFGGH